MKVKTEGEVEAGVETGRNEGHPKLHGRIFETSFGPGCIYGLNPHPPSSDLTSTRDWAV
jgi:hypothetical protein